MYLGNWIRTKNFCKSLTYGEGRKGARRMPRCQEPKKDGANAEMPRGAVSEH